MNSFQSFRGLHAPNTVKTELEDLGFFIIRNSLTKDVASQFSFDITTLFNEQSTDLKLHSSERGQLRSPFIKSSSIRSLLDSDFHALNIFPLIGESSILHLCNGQLVKASSQHNQSLWHRDFNKPHICDPLLAVNALFFLPSSPSCFDQKYSFGIIPGSHKFNYQPNFSLFDNSNVYLSPGDCLLFNSQLWHRVRDSEYDQIFLNLMYTVPYIKQQINLLGVDELWLEKYGYSVDSDFARLLGWWSRPPSSVDEFRNPPHGIRTYRSGEG